MSRPFRRRAIDFFKATFVGGVFVLAPLVVLLIIVGKVVEVVYSAIEPALGWLPFDSAAGVALAVVIAVAGVVALCFAAGLVAETALTKRFVRWIESAVLSNLPGYGLMKGVGANLLGAEGAEARRVVLARLESSWAIGFAMDTLDDGRVVVFVPGVPNAFSGALHIMDAGRVEPLDVSIRAAIDCLNRLGGNAAEVLRGKKPAAAGS